MTNKYTRSKYKGVKWKNTRYAKAFIFRTGWMAIQRIMIAEQAKAQILRIRSTKADTIEGKIAKSDAIVNTLENAVFAIKSIG